MRHAKPAVVLLVLAVGAGATAVALASWRLPAAAGPYAVGTSLVNSARFPAPVQLWYPAAPGSRVREAPYRLVRTGRFMVLADCVHTGFGLDAPVAAGRFPLLVYAPGWGGRRTDNSALVGELVSHGFIVAAFDDPFPQPALDFSTAVKARDTIRWADFKAERMSAVASAIVDELASPPGGGEAPSRFAVHVEPSRVGAFGFSFGGAVAAETAVRDERIKVVANVDGWLFGEAVKWGVPRPFLLLGARTSRPPASAYEALFDRSNERMIVAGLRRHGGYFVEIPRAEHADFTDVALMPSLRSFRAVDRGGLLLHRTVSAYVVCFMQRYLSGKNVALPAATRDVRVRAFRDASDHPA